VWAGVETDADIDFAALHVGGSMRRLHLDVDVGAGRDEVAEPGQQPARGERGNRADAQAMAIVRRDVERRFLDFLERRLDALHIVAACSVSIRPRRCFSNSVMPSSLCKRTDLVADRAVRQIQFFGRARDAAATRDGDENAQGIE
jgi:hypothetical protein